MAFTAIQRVGPKRVGKHFKRTKEGLEELKAEMPFLWTGWQPVEWPDLDAAAASLAALAARRDTVLIAGALAPGLDPAGQHVRRRLAKGDEEPTVVDQPQTWVAVDLDDCVSEGADDDDRLVSAILAQLPPLFHDAGFVAQWTSSHLVKNPDPNVLRVRLFFPLSQPTDMADIAAVMLGAGPAVDRSLYQPQSVIFVADPVFSGMPDPVADRIRIIDGPSVPALPKAPAAVSRPSFEPGLHCPANEVAAVLAEHSRMLDGPGATRHGVGLSLVCELLGRGADVDVVRQAADDLMEQNPKGARPWQAAEVDNFVAYWEDHRPLLRTPTLEAVFPDMAEDEEGAAEDGSGRHWDENESHASAEFLRNKYPKVCPGVWRIVRLQETDWEWQGKAWARRDDEWLPSILNTDGGGLRQTAITSLATAVRRTIYNDAPFAPPMRLDGKAMEHDVVICDNGPVTIVGDEPRLGPHDPALFTVSPLPFPFMSSQGCPNWEAFLCSTFAGNDTVIAELQKFCGYLLERDSRRQRFALLVGSSGSGKGVISEVMRHLVGTEATTSPSLATLDGDFTLESLLGKRLVVMSEATDAGKGGVSPTAVDVLKRITGHDPVRVNRKNKQAIEFLYEGKVVLATNSIPALSDHSGALLRRVVPFSFLHSVPIEDQDPELFAKRLLPEMPGILNWAIKGRAMLRRDGWSLANAQQQTLDRIKETTDPLARFCSDAIRTQEGSETSSARLYAAYLTHSEAHGRGRMSHTRFINQILERLGLANEIKRAGGGNTVPGITLTIYGESLAQSVRMGTFQEDKEK